MCLSLWEREREREEVRVLVVRLLVRAAWSWMVGHATQREMLATWKRRDMARSPDRSDRPF